MKKYIKGLYARHFYYNTWNFVVYSNPGELKTRLSAFPISTMAGSYCDNGQNYKNLNALIKSLGMYLLWLTLLISVFKFEKIFN